jgi:hypothetical protein
VWFDTVLDALATLKTIAIVRAIFVILLTATVGAILGILIFKLSRPEVLF